MKSKQIGNREIGQYLRGLLAERGMTQRAFCIELLKRKIGKEPESSAIINMCNRLNQTLQGKTGIQLDELLLYADILGVSCEEILSCGTRCVKSSSHMTNYDMASSDDPLRWEAYLSRQDCTFLNCDEYGKTVLDYLFEFKNYGLLKFLVEQKIIWFSDEEKNVKLDSFGAGTSIKCGDFHNWNHLQSDLSLRDDLRRRAIVLAVENEDIPMLETFRARELPFFGDEHSYWSNYSLKNYRDEKMLDAIAEYGDQKVLDYFAQEYTGENNEDSSLLYPFLGDLVNHLIEKNRVIEAEGICGRIAEHNCSICKTVETILDKSIRCVREAYEGLSAVPSDEQLKQGIARGFEYSPEDGRIRNLNIYPRIPFLGNVVQIPSATQNERMHSVERANGYCDQLDNLLSRDDRR